MDRPKSPKMDDDQFRGCFDQCIVDVMCLATSPVGPRKNTSLHAVEDIGKTKENIHF